MAIKLYLFLVTSFLCKGNFAEPFHFQIQDPIDPFVGREDFLQILHETLTRKVVVDDIQLSSITFVTGRGGVGKTETTRKYIQTYSDAFENVIWIEAETEITVENSFRALAKSKIISDNVQIESESETKSEPSDTKSESESGNQIQERNENIPTNHSKMTDKLIQNIYQVLGRDKRRTLMIFDNVDSIPWRFFPSDLHKNSDVISDGENDLIPPSILILRKKGQSSSGKGQKQMDSVKWLLLAPFTDEENMNYILHYPNLKMTSDDMPEVKVIENARLLGQLSGGVPLALKQAMAFISIGFKKHPEKGLEKYLNLYKDLKGRNDADFSSFAVSSTSEPESAMFNPIFLTWAITREKLSQGFRGELTTFIMDSLPYFPSSKMSIRLLFFLFSGGKEPFRDQSYHNERAILIKNAISTLHRYSIVSIDRDQSDPKVDLNLDLVSGTLSMHRELQSAVLKTFKEEETEVQVEEETVFLTKFNQMVSWLVTNSQKFLDKIVEENELLSLNELYSLAAILDRLESTAETADNGGPDVSTLRVLALGRFKVALRFQKLESFEGEENCRKLLKSSLTKLDRIEPESESILKNSRWLREMMNQVEKTFIFKIEHNGEGGEKPVDRDLALKLLKLQETVLEVATEVLGEYHPFHLVCLDRKADAMWRIESPPSFREKALALYDLLYEVYTLLFGEKNQESVMALHKIAERYYRLGDLDKSLKLFFQVLELEKDVFGPTHPYVIHSMQALVAIFAKRGDHKEALELSKALQDFHQVNSELKTSIKGLAKTGGDSQEIDDNKENNLEKDMEMSSLHNMANNYVNLNQPWEAYKIWENLYNTGLKNRGPDDLRTVRDETEMARMLYVMKDYDKAMKMQLHVLQIREQLLGPDDSTTMDTKFDLANLYYAKRNYNEALEFYTLVYDFRKKTLGAENEYTLSTLDRLADVHRDLNHNDLGHQMKTEVYTAKKKLFGEEALETLNALKEVAMTSSKVGSDRTNAQKGALEILKKVYNAKKKILGPTHDDTLTVLFLLSNLQAELGDHEKAMRQLEGAYDFLVGSQEHGSESPLIGATLHIMSQVRKMQGKYGLALKLDKQALEINKKALGPEHPSTVSILDQIASMNYYQQNYDEALKYYEESHSIMTKVYGPENHKTMETKENMGNIYLKKKEYKKASEIYYDLYDTRSKILGARHTSTLSALFGLAVLGSEVGRHDEALGLLQEVVTGKTAAEGPTHETTINAMEYLALTYTNLNNFEDALKTFEQVYEGRRVNLGEEHRHTIGTMANMAMCSYKLGHLDKGIQLITQVYEQRLKNLGPDHPDTKKALSVKTSMESDLNQKIEL